MRWHALAASLLVIPAVTLATSITPHTLAQRAQEAERVALVQVTSTQTVIENGDPRRMKTVTEITVGQSFKGEGPVHLQVIQMGGKWGLWESHIPGDAVFETGETAVVFLRCSQPTQCYLVALGAGVLRMVDGQLLVPDLHTGLFSKQSLPQVLAQLKPGAPQVVVPVAAKDRPASAPVKGAK